MRLLWFDYIFSRLYILTVPLIVLVVSLSLSTSSPIIKDSALLTATDSLSHSSDLVYSDSNDRNTVHDNSNHVNRPDIRTNDQQVIYINHGNGAISSIRRGSHFKSPFSPHVTTYPKSLFDNHNDNSEDDDNVNQPFKLEPIPLIGNFGEGIRNEEDSISHSRGSITDQPFPPSPSIPSTIRSNRRPSRRSTTSTDTNKPSRIIYESQPSSLSTPLQPKLQPSPSPILLKPQPPPSPVTVSSLKPILPPHSPIRGPQPVTDSFIPFNFDNFFSRDPNFDIERSVINDIGRNQENRSPPSGSLSHSRSPANQRYQNNVDTPKLDNSPSPPLLRPSPPPSPVSSSTVDNESNRLNKFEDERTTVEPRVRKQVTNSGISSPPSAYSGQSGTTPPPRTFGEGNQFMGPANSFEPSIGGEDGNGFLPNYGPGFGLPGGQDIFPFFETPFLPISPTSSADGGFQRRRLTPNNHHNNLRAYGNLDHHSSPPPPPPPPPSSVSSINDNSLGNGGYPSYNIYKGGDDNDAGVKWPKIFKFTDGRVNLSDFERNKKSGKVKFHNKEDAYFDDIRRDSFLILHGGTYN